MSVNPSNFVLVCEPHGSAVEIEARELGFFAHIFSQTGLQASDALNCLCLFSRHPSFLSSAGFGLKRLFGHDLLVQKGCRWMMLDKR